jgi:hypothetical protein
MKDHPGIAGASGRIAPPPAQRRLRDRAAPAVVNDPGHDPPGNNPSRPAVLDDSGKLPLQG